MTTGRTLRILGLALGGTALGLGGLRLLHRPQPAAPEAPSMATAEARPPSAKILDCRLQAGDELAFRVHAVTDSVAGATGHHLELQAVMHWNVLQSRGTGWLVGVALDQVALDQRPETATPELRAAFGEPFVIDVRRDCRFKGLAFAPRSDARVRGQLEALIQAMEIVLPGAPVQRWTARQDDALGSYQAHYRLEAATDAGRDAISRRRFRYFAFHLPSPGPRAGGPSAEILGSQARATLDGAGRWLTSLSTEDHLKVSVGDHPLAEVTGSIQLQRVDSPPLARLAGLAVDRFVFGAGPQAEAGPPRPKEPDPALAASNLRGALADFQRRLGAGKGGMHDAVSTLAGYLARRADAIGELMDALRDGSIDPQVHAPLFLALQLTGTPEAERALAQGVGDGRLSGVDRMRAAVALADVPHPSQQAVDALVTEARARGGDAEGQDVARSALLALGTLDRNAAPTDPALAAQARRELDARLRGGPPADEVLADLDAVGNAGDGALLADVEPYTHDPAAQVRAHAAEAYRRAEGAADEARLIAWLRAEPDAGVRRAILASLTERVEGAGGEESDALVAAAGQALATEPDPQARGLLIRLLGEAAASVPEAKQALIAQFHRESQPELLELIGRYCSVSDLG
jgi:hypothetical protein